MSISSIFLPFKIFVFFIFNFFANGFFSYDFELIIVSSILTFVILFYYGFNKVFYFFFNLKKKSLGTEYVNFLVAKQAAQDKLKYFCYLLDLREQFVIESFLYVYSFMKAQAILVSLSRIFLLCYLFKERLIFFFKEYALVIKIKEVIINLRVVYYQYILKILSLEERSAKKNIIFVSKFKNLEIFDARNEKFVSLDKCNKKNLSILIADVAKFPMKLNITDKNKNKNKNKNKSENKTKTKSKTKNK